MQREEILAFVQARPVDGGGGAVMVLLKSNTQR
jgi:DNA-nicking Smr family endonuclease